MRPSAIGLAGLAVALGGCDIGARTRVEALYNGNAPAQIAVDQTHVYWTESTTDDYGTVWTIKSVPKKALPQVLPEELGHGQLITVESETVWYADPAGNVSRRDPDSMVTSMFTPADAAPVALVRDDANLYEGITIGNPATRWEIWTIPRDGSAPSLLASDPTDTFSLQDLVSDGSHVYFGVGVHVDAVPTGEIRRVPVDGGDVEVVAPAHGEPRVLREAGDGLLWYGIEQVLDSGAIAGSLYRALKDGSEPVRALISMTGPTSLTLDEKFAYWIDAANAEIWVERIGHVGGNLTSLVPLAPAGASTAVAVDDTYVYWSDLGVWSNLGPPVPALNRMLKK